MGKWGARWKEMIFIEKIGDFRCYLLNPAEDSDFRYDYSLDYIRPFPQQQPDFMYENDYKKIEYYRAEAQRLDNKNKLNVNFSDDNSNNNSNND